MPSYDLVCSNCGHAFEITLHRFITEEDKLCPECGSTKVEQQLSVFEFRGTRWKPTQGTVLPLRTQAKWPSKGPLPRPEPQPSTETQPGTKPQPSTETQPSSDPQ